MALIIADNDKKAFLDTTGLSALITKIKAADDNVKRELDDKITTTKDDFGKSIEGVKTDLGNSIGGVQTDVKNLQDAVTAIQGSLDMSGGSGDGTTVQGKIDSALSNLVSTENFQFDYSNKTITITLNGSTRTIDATEFVKDSFVREGKVEGDKLVLTLATVERSGEASVDTKIEIPFGSLLTDLDRRVGVLETAVGNAESGLTKKVADLEEAYKAADTALGNRIDGLNTKVNDLDTAYKAADTKLENDYKFADHELDDKITALDGKVGTLKTNLEGYADTQAKTAYSAIGAIDIQNIAALFSI